MITTAKNIKIEKMFHACIGNCNWQIEHKNKGETISDQRLS